MSRAGCAAGMLSASEDVLDAFADLAERVTSAATGPGNQRSNLVDSTIDDVVRSTPSRAPIRSPIVRMKWLFR